LKAAVAWLTISLASRWGMLLPVSRGVRRQSIATGVLDKRLRK
jgi:hypothetical protein